MRRLRIDQWRCNRHTNRKRKPDQHEAGYEFDIAKVLHDLIIAIGHPAEEIFMHQQLEKVGNFPHKSHRMIRTRS
jgi:hypothetical protein